MIENDLREALRDRASTYETSPHAWLGVQQRVRRTRRMRWAALAAVPVATAAVIAGVPLVLSHGGADSATTGARTAPATGASPERQDAYQTQTAEHPPIGETLALVNPDDGRIMRLWFSRMPQQKGLDQPVAPDAPKYDVLCWAVQSALRGGSVAGCPMDDDPRHSGEYAWYVGGTAGKWPRADTAISYGVARAPVAKVQAVAKDGTLLPGTIYRPEGAPATVWAVTYPARAQVRAFQFSDADGKILVRMTPSKRSDELTSAKPVEPAVDLRGGLTARLYEDGTLAWLNHDEVVVGTEIMATGESLKDAIPSDWHFGRGHWFGIAPAGTARIELTLKDGRRVSADAIPDPWHRGFTLYSAPYEHAGDVYAEGYSIVCYDAEGKQTTRVDESAHPPLWTDAPIATPARPTASGPDRPGTPVTDQTGTTATGQTGPSSADQAGTSTPDQAGTSTPDQPETPSRR
ncbi:hypothetical protein [Sphaerisporangium perillae]|uniref:hypothetical protein n=1 Tax=Sphaerisporangium perillae TaxID=2935860 RepID=UPI00200C7989|nr:hypothetical protein [Sphaerisporangium perillae]